MKYTIGFDLGGTKIAAALVNENGKIISYTKLPLNLKGAGTVPKAQHLVIQLISDLTRDFKNRFPSETSNKNLRGIGLASAGPMNIEKGLLINPANFPGWKTFPLLKKVNQAVRKCGFKGDVHFQNDAMSAAFAEGWIGGAKKMKSFAVITVGTGIGTGVILNGKPCQTKGAGSEFGHILIDFSSAKNNSVEEIASGTALVRRAWEKGFKGNSVEELLLENNKKYQILFDEMSLALAILSFNLSIGFHLDGIFLSGGLIKIQDHFLKKTIQHYKKLIQQFNPIFECPIKIAKTKNLAGVLGAAFLPWQEQ